MQKTVAALVWHDTYNELILFTNSDPETNIMVIRKTGKGTGETESL
jgi:hypothetical protein